MIKAENVATLDMNQVPTIYADEIASAEIIGPNVRIVFVETKTIGNQVAQVPVLELIRPLVSCLRLTLRDLLARQMTDDGATLQPMQ